MHIILKHSPNLCAEIVAMFLKFILAKIQRVFMQSH